VDRLDTTGMAGDIAGSASHGDRNTDHTVASTPNIAATVSNSGIADTENPNMDCSRRDHRPAP
jgi:hypothetical protein